MIRSSYGVRLPVYGDGTSKTVTFDLRDTMVIMGPSANSYYTLIPLQCMPHVVISVVVGGPSITVETEQARETTADLDGYELTLNFSHPLLFNKEAYTVEIIFGRAGVVLPEAPNEDFIA